ncbi:MAG: hypothetical protein WBG29_16490 [Candidatus Acidiferrales bacterium]
MAPEAMGIWRDLNADYTVWLERVQHFVDAESTNSWALGDLLVEGDDQFNMGNDIPRHLLIHPKNDGSGEYASEHISKFWPDVAQVTGTGTQTLKEKLKVSRAFPPDKRFVELSYTHHRYAAGYDRGLEYLQACIVPGGKPKPVDFLWALIRKEEHAQEDVIQSSKYLRFQVPEEMYAKLRDVSHYHKQNIPELSQKACLEALQQLLDAEARKISLALFGEYEEGRWPFKESVEETIKKVKKARKRRHRLGNNLVFSEQRRQIAHARWNRGDRVR